jgi:hypothetical protein
MQITQATIPVPQKKAIQGNGSNNRDHPILQRDAPNREFVAHPITKRAVHLDIYRYQLVTRWQGHPLCAAAPRRAGE